MSKDLKFNVEAFVAPKTMAEFQALVDELSVQTIQLAYMCDALALWLKSNPQFKKKAP